MSFANSRTAPGGQEFFEECFYDPYDPDDWLVTATNDASVAQVGSAVRLTVPAGRASPLAKFMSSFFVNGSGRLRFSIIFNHVKQGDVYLRCGLITEDDTNQITIGADGSVASTGNNFVGRIKSQGSVGGRDSSKISLGQAYSINPSVFEFEIVRRRGSVTINYRQAGTSVARWSTIVHRDIGVPSLVTPMRILFEAGCTASQPTAVTFDIQDVRWASEPTLSVPLNVTYSHDATDNGGYSTTSVALDSTQVNVMKNVPRPVTGFSVSAGGTGSSDSGGSEGISSRTGMIIRVNGAPTAHDVRVEISLDGTTWLEIAQLTNLTSSYQYLEYSQLCRAFRVRVASFTGGTSPTINGWAVGYAG